MIVYTNNMEIMNYYIWWKGFF